MFFFEIILKIFDNKGFLVSETGRLLIIRKYPFIDHLSILIYLPFQTISGKTKKGAETPFSSNLNQNEKSIRSIG